MPFDYRSSVALVTGASSGIGRAIALDLAAHGTTVVAAARRQEMLEAVVETCRANAPESLAVVADVSDRAAAEGLVTQTIDRFGRVDVLINNAGIPMRVHAARLTVEDVDQTMRTNFMSCVYTTLAVLPSMLARSTGRIVNIASVAGRFGSPRESAYSASKFAMVGFSEVLASDLAGSGVRVQCVYPGPIDTEIWDKGQEPAAYRGRFYPPADVARAVRAAIDRGNFETWVPVKLRPVAVFRAIAPDRYIASVARYDRRSSRER